MSEKKPYLIAISGYRLAGKSIVAKFIEERFNFRRVSWDRHIDEAQGPGPVPQVVLRQKELYVRKGDNSRLEKEFYYDKRDAGTREVCRDAWRRVLAERDELLDAGLDVVIDAQCNTAPTRRKIYDTLVPTNNVLLYVNVTLARHQDNMRMKANGVDIPLEAVRFVRGEDRLEVPESDETFKVLRLFNRNSWDSSLIPKKLEKFFG